MARLARIVLPGIPYHVTRRGNRRQQAFFEAGDYALRLHFRPNRDPKPLGLR